MIRLYAPHQVNTRRWFHLALVVAVLFSQLSPLNTQLAAAAPSASAVETIGDFLSLGRNTVREARILASEVSADTAVLLNQLSDNIEYLIETLEAKYQANLFITVDLLDTVTRNRLIEIQGLLDEVNLVLQQTIQQIEVSAIEVIRRVSLEIRRITLELEQSLKDVIVTGVTGTVYIIDRAAFQALLIIAFMFLAIGTLMFIWITAQGRMRGPAGLFSLLWVSFFGAFLLPQPRVYAITYTGIGVERQLATAQVKPRILDVFPKQIIVGQTAELEIWGNTLLPNNQAPTVTAATYTLPIKASSNDQIVVDSSTLTDPNLTGSTSLVLAYNEFHEQAVVQFVQPEKPRRPADLVISGFAFEPSQPMYGENVHVVVTIGNNGETSSGSFVVNWKPFAAHAGIDQRVDAIEPAQTRTVSFDFGNYPLSDPWNPSEFETVLNIDTLNEIPEGEGENNNGLTQRITIAPRPIISTEVSMPIAAAWPDPGGEPGEFFDFHFDQNVEDKCNLDTSRGGGSYDIPRGDDDRVPAHAVSYPAGFNVDLDFVGWASLQSIYPEFGHPAHLRITLRGLGGHGWLGKRGPERFTGTFTVYLRCLQQ